VVGKVYATEGQQVKRGQLLFTLDDQDARAELAQARADLVAEQEMLRVVKSGGRSDQVIRSGADLKKAQATLGQLRRDNESLIRLVAQKAATLQELDQNRVALAHAEADVQSLDKMTQASERQAQSDIERTALLVENAQARIRDDEAKVNSAHGVAPLDGTLYAQPIRQGDFVKEGDLLAEMADLHHVRARAFIDEPELGQIAVDQPVDILWDAHPGRVWSGRTGTVPKEVVTHGARNVGELLCSLSNDQLDLLPNTTVDVHIHVSERPNVLVIPRGAVYIDGNKRYVYRVEEQRLHRREITVGIANPTLIEVVSGLKEGDVVGLPGEVRLRENLRVRAMRPE
jgi:HlyD family secretion protein